MASNQVQPVAAQPVQTCSTCKFFAPTKNNRGECHRYPPHQTANNELTVYPITVTNDWCGEWVKKT